jgi:hypothetical protein
MGEYFSQKDFLKISTKKEDTVGLEVSSFWFVLKTFKKLIPQ